MSTGSAAAGPARPGTAPTGHRGERGLLARLRRRMDRLRFTPLHPQWFAFLRESRHLAADCGRLAGVVLDVGCAGGTPRRYLPAAARYVGLDYLPTAAGWYGTRPEIFGNAEQLPFKAGSVDHVLLLDVLEHLPDPERCLAELARALKPGGTLTIQVPFLYPLHDEPRDFHRWTRHGLARAAARHGFDAGDALAVGHPLESAALNANIALTRTVLNWIAARNPLALLAVALPPLVLIGNCTAWLLARLGRADDLMPYAYRSTWTRR